MSTFALPFFPSNSSLTACSVRLATHIYAEYLLDRDHYMDWLLDSLEKSPQSKLPIWVLIVQIYWKDMLRLRRTARKLVSVFLFHLHEVRCCDSFVFGRQECIANRKTCRFKTTPTGTSFLPWRPV